MKIFVYYVYLSLFRNLEVYALNEMTWSNASKFPIFYVNKNAKPFFPFFTSGHLKKKKITKHEMEKTPLGFRMNKI